MCGRCSSCPLCPKPFYPHLLQGDGQRYKLILRTDPRLDIMLTSLSVPEPFYPHLLQGDGQRYKLILRTDPGWDSIAYCHSFDTKPGVWQTVRIPFKDFFPVFRARTLKVRSWLPFLCSGLVPSRRGVGFLFCVQDMHPQGEGQGVGYLPRVQGSYPQGEGLWAL